jgi:cyclophilin family peptidyl-prolyl cis-trans isomerase
MYDLVKTTYARSFDTRIVYKYLHSNSEQDIKAAILSIAQSEDTLFVPELLNLDLNKYGKEICFALAQIGKCDQSIKFLWKYLYSSPPPNYFPKIFFAIGKIGNEGDLKKLVEFYNAFDGPIFPYEGISEAILQFQIRGITSDDAKLILENEILHNLSPRTRIANTLFVLSRYDGSNRVIEKLKDILKDINFIKSQNLENIDSLSLLKLESIQYALMNFQKIKYFPAEWKFRHEILKNDDVLFYIELAKAVVFASPIEYGRALNNISTQMLELDDNNLAIQSAISLRSIEKELQPVEKPHLKRLIRKIYYDNKRNRILKSELLLTGYLLTKDFDYFDKLILDQKFVDKYRVRFYSKNPNDSLAIYKLSEFYKSLDLNVKIESLTALIELSKNEKFRSLIANQIFDALLSVKAPLISIAADGIDSFFIAENSSKLKEIISDQLNAFMDSPDFIEATMSLVNLAEKIDSEFYFQMIKKTKRSKLYSIRKFVSSKTGDKQIGYKELDKFDDIWSYAFKYHQAKLNTSKGDITINFNSEIAPISVANFCMLADKIFYNGIKLHRVVPGFVIQAGDPTATSWGGPGYDIVSEFSDTDFGIGYVGMASAGKDTESSQFFVMQGSYPHLNSRYTLFAKVTTGMDVVYKINEDDFIISIELK